MSTHGPGEPERRGLRHRRTPDAPGTGRHLRPIGTWTAVALTVAVLVATNLAVHRWGDLPGLITAVLVSVLLLAVLRWADGTWDEAGVAPGTFARGARWALTLIGLVGLVYLAGALLPPTRTLFEDQRYEDMSGSELLLRAFVLVPVGTVLLEEIAFRGVLYGLVRRARGVIWATVVSSLLFGLWHVLPSLHLASAKPALNSVFGDSAFGAALAILGAVLFTAAAGVLFCELRRRSGSLLAPMGLHWAVNALGYLFGFLLR